jgi:hypothetical protein
MSFKNRAEKAEQIGAQQNGNLKERMEELKDRAE